MIIHACTHTHDNHGDRIPTIAVKTMEEAGGRTADKRSKGQVPRTLSAFCEIVRLVFGTSARAVNRLALLAALVFANPPFIKLIICSLNFSAGAWAAACSQLPFSSSPKSSSQTVVVFQTFQLEVRGQENERKNRYTTLDSKTKKEDNKDNSRENSNIFANNNHRYKGQEWKNQWSSISEALSSVVLLITSTSFFS